MFLAETLCAQASAFRPKFRINMLVMRSRCIISLNAYEAGISQCNHKPQVVILMHWADILYTAATPVITASNKIPHRIVFLIFFLR